MSTYIKTKSEQKSKLNKEYKEKLFTVASLVLPSIVIGGDFSSAEAVDLAVIYAKDLLAALDYKVIGGEDETEHS